MPSNSCYCGCQYLALSRPIVLLAMLLIILQLNGLTKVLGVPTMTIKRPICEPQNGTVALILARGGSKGVPLKNLSSIRGISLLARSLRTIHESRVFSETWVSTDHEAIAETAEQYHAKVHHRPAAVAQDDTTSIASVQEFLHHHHHVRNVALIQCTSPFLRAKYLCRAMEAFAEPDVDCVFSVVRSFHLRWQRSNDTDQIIPLNFDPQRRPRRQDWSGELVEAGMIYVASRRLLESGRFQNDRCRVIEIDAADALEIDTADDLELANIMDHRECEADQRGDCEIIS